MTTLSKTLSELVCAAALTCLGASASSVFTFDGDGLGTSTNFTDSSNGISATFSSAADPGGFVVYSSMYSTLTGNLLGDPGPAGVDGLSLSVAFNAGVNTVSLDFATSDFTAASPLTLDAYENGALVGSATASGAFLPGFSFPEGQISYSGAAFNSLIISSPAMDFAVDNITVSQTPEPPLSLLLGAGLLAVGIPSIHAKKRRGVCQV